MYKIDSTGNVAGAFTNGTPGVQIPTIVDATWLNAVQAELVDVATATGAALNKADSTQVLTAIKQLCAQGYKRDYAPNNAYASLGAFLAGTYVSMGVELSSAGEICHFRESAPGESDTMLYSVVVSVGVGGCTCGVIVPHADNNVKLYLDGTLENTWALGTSTAAYNLVMAAGVHVVQFVNENTSTESPAAIYVNDWMTGQPVTWLRAAHS